MAQTSYNRWKSQNRTLGPNKKEKGRTETANGGNTLPKTEEKG